MDVPVGMPDEDALHEWLFDDGHIPGREAGIAEGLLEIFDTFSAEAPLPAPEDAMAKKIAQTDQAVYLGREEMRNAVLRFLFDAWKGNAELLLLYSDENQEWLTGDRDFLMRWSALMSACVTNGTRIKIIHNVDRDLSEMTDAIRSWLRLSSMMSSVIICRISSSLTSPTVSRRAMRDDRRRRKHSSPDELSFVLFGESDTAGLMETVLPEAAFALTEVSDGESEGTENTDMESPFGT